MRERLKKFLSSTEFTLLLGLVIVPIISLIFINISPESPLYTSISRIAWIHGHWFSTFFWAVTVMGAIVFLTYRMVKISPLSERSKRGFLICQIINISLVFIGCLVFPAKADNESAVLINYLHDYLTTVAWAMYGIGLIAYSMMVWKRNRFLGFTGCCIMIFVVWSSMFFLRQVVDPNSYVGASAVSEVYIINSLLIYLVVMYVMEKYEKERTKDDF